MEEIKDEYTVNLETAIRKVKRLYNTYGLVLFSNTPVKRINSNHGKLVHGCVYSVHSIVKTHGRLTDVSINEQGDDFYFSDSTNFLMREEDLDRIINSLTSQNSNLILDNVW